MYLALSLLVLAAGCNAFSLQSGHKLARSSGNKLARSSEHKVVRSSGHKVVRSCRQMSMIIDSALAIDPSYNLAAGCATIGLVAGVLENFKGVTGKFFGGLAIVFTIFGAFVAFQTTTLRFTFDDSNFALVSSLDGKGGEASENKIVGGESTWAYKSFLNYDFLPSEEFPILGMFFMFIALQRRR
jgi:hypothetical protein